MLDYEHVALGMLCLLTCVLLTMSEILKQM